MGDISNLTAEEARLRGEAALKAGRRAEAKFFLNHAATLTGISNVREMSADELLAALNRPRNSSR